MECAGATINEQGRVVIPAAIRRLMEVEGPTDLLFRFEDGVVTVETIEAAVARARHLVASRIGTDRALVDQLLADRRAETAAE